MWQMGIQSDLLRGRLANPEDGGVYGKEVGKERAARQPSENTDLEPELAQEPEL
jgi:hypothetical protein